EAGNRRTFHLNETGAVLLDDGVAVDRDVARTVRDLKRITAAAPSLVVDIGKHVRSNDDRSRLPARVVVVDAEDVHGAAAVTHHVVLEQDVADFAPRTAAVLVAHGEQNCEAGLRRQPVVFERVVADDDVPGVLQLEEVFYLPAFLSPRFGLAQRVAGYGD